MIGAPYQPKPLASAPSDARAPLTRPELELRAELPPSSVIGRLLMNRYLPQGLAHDGAFSVRYRADDLATGETVCLEFLPRRAIASFGKIRHAVAKLAALGDPNIVEVTGRGMAGGAWPFLVTESATGDSLRDVLAARQPLELARVVRIGAQGAEALAAAHGAGVLHGALTPERIVCRRRDRAFESVKVSGFGLVSLVEASPDALLSSSSELYTYTSPEAAAGQRLDARSDIYSLGAILYELIAGEPAFEGSAVSVLRQHRVLDPGLASRRRGSSDLPFRVMDKIVARCLAKAPEARYANAAELAADLARLGAALARARGEGRPANANAIPDGWSTPSSAGAGPAECTPRERHIVVEQRPAHHPPRKSRVGMRQLPKVIVQRA